MACVVKEAGATCTDLTTGGDENEGRDRQRTVSALSTDMLECVLYD